MTKIIKCGCKNSYQDAKYGAGNRVHNKTAKHPPGGGGGAVRHVRTSAQMASRAKVSARERLLALVLQLGASAHSCSTRHPLVRIYEARARRLLRAWERELAFELSRIGAALMLKRAMEHGYMVKSAHDANELCREAARFATLPTTLRAAILRAGRSKR